MSRRLSRIGLRIGVVVLIAAAIPAAAILGLTAFLFLLSIAGRHP